MGTADGRGRYRETQRRLQRAARRRESSTRPASIGHSESVPPKQPHPEDFAPMVPLPDVLEPPSCEARAPPPALPAEPPWPADPPPEDGDAPPAEPPLPASPPPADPAPPAPPADPPATPVRSGRQNLPSGKPVQIVPAGAHDSNSSVEHGSEQVPRTHVVPDPHAASSRQMVQPVGAITHACGAPLGIHCRAPCWHWLTHWGMQYPVSQRSPAPTSHWLLCVHTLHPLLDRPQVSTAPFAPHRRAP